jgi:hypothetical protein
MTGVVWFCQLVHYPLIDRGERENFVAFAQDYQRRTGWVVVPGLIGELISAIGLVVLWPTWWTAAGLALLAVIWGFTISCQIPDHGSLARGFDAQVHRHLVRWNLPRSVAWLVRAIVVTATLHVHVTLPPG